MEYYLALKRNEAPTCPCYDMDKLRHYHAKRKKPDAKGHTWHDTTYTKRPEQVCLQGQEVGMEAEGPDVTANRHRGSFWGDENLLELDGGDVYTHGERRKHH